MSDLHVWKSEHYWVIAESDADAHEVLKDNDFIKEEEGEEEFEQLPDDKQLKIFGGEDMESHTCAEWVRIEGHGLLGGTEY